MQGWWLMGKTSTRCADDSGQGMTAVVARGRLFARPVVWAVVSGLALAGFAPGSASGQAADDGFGDVPGQEVKAETDFSALPMVVQAQLQQLDGKYGASAWRSFDKSRMSLVAERGNSKVVSNGAERLLYCKDLLKFVHMRDEKGNGYDLSYYPNGRMNSYVEYRAGEVGGVFVKFHLSGKLEYQMEYARDAESGLVGQWDDAGIFLGSNVIASPLNFIVNVSTNE